MNINKNMMIGIRSKAAGLKVINSRLSLWNKKQSGVRMSSSMQDQRPSLIAVILIAAISSIPMLVLSDLLGNHQDVLLGEEELPPVSFWPGFKQRISISGGGRTREIPDSPLNEQPDPQYITHIDADLRSCLGPAGAQLNCGACYAFSWNSLLEWHHCKQTADGELLDVSEQHIIDCSNFAGFDRCRSGKIEDVRMFAETFGFYLEQEYPYTAKYTGQSIEVCKSSRRHFRTTQWKRLIVNRTEWEHVLEEQPILVQAHLPSDIIGYKGGILSGTNCNNRMPHGMLLVGHGREKGEPYWLVRNSMGKKWGESGHFRLARNDSTMSHCFSTGWVAKFKFDSIDADRYEEFYSQIEFEPTEHILA